MSKRDLFQRREMLSLLVSMGAMGALSYILGGCSTLIILGGLRKVTGDVKINGKPVSSKNIAEHKITNDSNLSTGPASTALFVVGKNAFLLRKNSQLSLIPAKSNPNEISGFELNTGGVLSVFAKGNRRLRTPVAIIGIKGTGAYLEVDTEKTYICTCYGTSHLQVKEAPDVTETVTAEHHDAPRFIWAAKKTIRPAFVYNHSDQELIMLEELVGRVPPFVNPDGSIKIESKGGYYGY
ncbi:MAG: hypothetical protein MAG581_01228 [Deltaproteobacteria bacterium]|jgi:hypothetical protein|nr:hypothetical protein [Deltaproteobacteria bacterium]